MKTPAHFFSCDWGTSSFRLRLVALPECRLLDEIREDAGVKTIHASVGNSPDPRSRAEAFASFLRARLEAMCRRQAMVELGSPVLISGMASSSVGWRELPYASVPLPLDGSGLVMSPASEEALDAWAGNVWLISGIRTANDIMRGEECEIIGICADGGLDGLPERCVMVLPGTHSKHVWLTRNEILDFRTSMTGEICDVMARHSLLRVSVQWPLPNGPPDGAARVAFQEGAALAHDQGLISGFFRVRTRSVLEGVDPGINGWFLSGLVIGAEVSGLVDAAGESTILLAGGPRFSALYPLAFAAIGFSERLTVIPDEWIDHATVRAHARLLKRILPGTPAAISMRGSGSAGSEATGGAAAARSGDVESARATEDQPELRP